MYFYANAIELSIYLMIMLALYLVVDVALGFSAFRQHLHTKAQDKIIYTQRKLDTDIRTLDKRLAKFDKAFKQTATFTFRDLARAGLVNHLGQGLATAVTQFALFQSMCLSDPHLTFSYENRIYGLMDQVKDIYMNAGNMEEAEAEQRIIDEIFFNLIELDFSGDWLNSTNLPNPAVAYFCENQVSS